MTWMVQRPGTYLAVQGHPRFTFIRAQKSIVLVADGLPEVISAKNVGQARKLAYLFREINLAVAAEVSRR